MSENSKNETIEEVVAEPNVEIATNLNISEDVIGIIAGLAASEVEGIAGMTLGFVDGINQILGSSKKYSKGVKIELVDRSQNSSRKYDRIRSISCKYKCSRNNFW